MEKFVKEKTIMEGKGEDDYNKDIGTWVTIKGNHIFIEKGQSVKDAISKRFDSSKKILKSVDKKDNDYYNNINLEYAKEWTNNLSLEERQIVFNYTCARYIGINRALRYGQNVGVYKKDIRILNEALDKYNLKEPITVYRYATATEQIFQVDDVNTLIGKEYKNNGFLSCSIDKKFVEDTINKSGKPMVYMELNIPPGKGFGAYIGFASHYEHEEHEFLLRNNLLFKINNAYKENNYIKIKGDLIKNGKKEIFGDR